MEKTKHGQIQEEVNKTMQSLDHLERVAGNPYLYSRIGAALEQPSAIRPKWLINWQMGLAGLLIVINAFSISNHMVNVRGEQRRASLDAISNSFSLDLDDRQDVNYFNLD